MKVRELQKMLAGLDPELEVLGYTEDEELLHGRTGFLLLEFEKDINVTDAELCRLDDGAPYLKFGKSKVSTPLGILPVTANF
ncbi:MAG TPA: hypothetical protein VHX86_08730 [Tepidisphaeraceae bacterium]|jgi:hypothetical protein|nr:hypothetical protein [Tepidisphaeraceae bacterium]